jgi:hypothetical protein
MPRLLVIGFVVLAMVATVICSEAAAFPGSGTASHGTTNGGMDGAALPFNTNFEVGLTGTDQTPSRVVAALSISGSVNRRIAETLVGKALLSGFSSRADFASIVLPLRI